MMPYPNLRTYFYDEKNPNLLTGLKKIQINTKYHQNIIYIQYQNGNMPKIDESYEIDSDDCIDESNSIFEPIFREQNSKFKRFRFHRNRKPDTKRWTVQQNQFYLQLIKEYQEVLQDKLMRRKLKIFQVMSDRFMKTKTGQQIRGHHKKLISRFKTINNIEEMYKRDLEKKKFKKIELSSSQQSEPQTEVLAQSSTQDGQWNWKSVFSF